MQENIAVKVGDTIKAEHYGEGQVIEVESFRLKAKLKQPPNGRIKTELWFYPGEFRVISE